MPFPLGPCGLGGSDLGAGKDSGTKNQRTTTARETGKLAGKRIVSQLTGPRQGGTTKRASCAGSIQARVHSIRTAEPTQGNAPSWGLNDLTRTPAPLAEGGVSGGVRALRNSKEGPEYHPRTGKVKCR